MVDGDGEVYAGDRTAVLGFASPGGVDSHHTAVFVQQRAAAVSRIQVGVGLKKALVRTLGRNYSRGYGRVFAQFRTQRETHGKNPLPNPDCVRVSQR